VRAVPSRIDLSGLPGSILLFTEGSCLSCDRVRKMLEGAGAAFDEIAYESEPGLHRSAGVTAVPLLVVRDGTGAVAGVAAGVPSRRKLRRLLTAAE
jgi:hypothetical protein